MSYRNLQFISCFWNQNLVPLALKVFCTSHLVVRPPQPLSVLSSDTGMAVLTKPRFLGPGGRTSRKMLKFPHAHQTKDLNALNDLS